MANLDDISGHARARVLLADGSYADIMAIVGGPLPAGSDRSGSITAANTAQSLAVANDARRALTGQNISTGDLWVNETGNDAAPNAAGSYRIPPGGTFGISTSRAISIVGATAGQKFTATEV